ncbi:Hypothetical_protein [Hexamita inflata]|uniref:Hypothetical_protein n=1 Tax=Hexamita inflata TaxID=28002 RepID=A0AA86UUK6_9EUKA|nr:Hypothetical protein HINF_LOCUS56204 [Hexamita inflata]
MPTQLRGKHVCSSRPRPQVQIRVLQRTFTPAQVSRKYTYARLAESVAQRVFDQDPLVQIWQVPNFFVPFYLPARSLGAIFIHVYSRKMPGGQHSRPKARQGAHSPPEAPTRAVTAGRQASRAPAKHSRRTKGACWSQNACSNRCPGSPKINSKCSRQLRQNLTRSLQRGLGAIISQLFLPGIIACNVLQHCALNSLPEVTRVPEFGAKFTSNLKTIHSEQLEGSGVGENPHSPTVHTYSHHSPIFIAIFKTTRGAKNEVAAQTSWKNSDLTHDIASMQYQFVQIHSYTASRLRPRSQLSANCDKPLALLPSLKVQQIA